MIDEGTFFLVNATGLLGAVWRARSGEQLLMLASALQFSCPFFANFGRCVEAFWHCFTCQTHVLVSFQRAFP
jgi:hypothetical protein